MSVAVRRDRPMRVGDFLGLIGGTPAHERWELIEGWPVLMAPPGERHQAIVANLIRRLCEIGEPRGCRALPGLGLLDEAADDYAPIPDIVVRGGPLLPDCYARDPLLVAEVLSPSTARPDRILKAGFYLGLETLRLFLIVHQDEPHIEVWRRAEPDWTFHVLRPGDTLGIPDLGDLDVAAVYAGVPFDPA